MTVKEIVSAIKADKPEISSVYFVGCGASMSDLYPSKYFLEGNSKKLRVGLHTANEFVYSTPRAVGSDSIVVTCSLSGGTPEAVAAAKKAMELGAEVVAVTIDANSPLAANAKYQIIHGFAKDYAAKMEKMTNVVALDRGNTQKNRVLRTGRTRFFHGRNSISPRRTDAQSEFCFRSAPGSVRRRIRPGIYILRQIHCRLLLRLWREQRW